MAKSRIRQIRFGDELDAAIEAEVGRRGVQFSEWIRSAAIEKLKHSARSRRASGDDLAKLGSELLNGRPYCEWCRRQSVPLEVVDGIRICFDCHKKGVAERLADRVTLGLE
jgi:hypothetical protein